jgi:hypothetical protein
MHYHLEIIMPPTGGIEATVDTIMEPYNEDPDMAGLDDDEREEREYMLRHAFWDWFQIGGRWAGHKKMARYNQGKLDAFHQWMKDEGVTVSALQWGKQELSPASQIPAVDAKWYKMFGVQETCPIFLHSNRNKGPLDGDVCELKDIPKSLTAERVIIAGPTYDETGIEARYMMQELFWNGCNHAKTDWDGTVEAVIDMQAESLNHAKDEWKEKVLPKDDWLVVTVDYHS